MPSGAATRYDGLVFVQSVNNMDLLPHLPPSKRWRSLLVALAVLFGISAITVWTWYELGQRQQREYQHRFALNVQALGEVAIARMNGYEMVLRGVASAFSGNAHPVSWAQWNEIVDQMQMQVLVSVRLCGLLPWRLMAWTIFWRACARMIDPIIGSFLTGHERSFCRFSTQARSTREPVPWLG